MHDVSQVDVATLAEYGGAEMLISPHSKRCYLSDVLRRVTLLTRQAGARLQGGFRPFKGSHWPYPLDPTKFHVVDDISFSGRDLTGQSTVEQAECRKVVERWLQSLPVDHESLVYVYYALAAEDEGCPAFVVRWKDYCDFVWFATYNVFEVVSVRDETLSWVLVFGPEPFGVFAEEGPISESLGDIKRQLGAGLKAIRSEA